MKKVGNKLEITKKDIEENIPYDFALTAYLNGRYDRDALLLKFPFNDAGNDHDKANHRLQYVLRLLRRWARNGVPDRGMVMDFDVYSSILDFVKILREYDNQQMERVSSRCSSKNHSDKRPLSRDEIEKSIPYRELAEMSKQNPFIASQLHEKYLMEESPSDLAYVFRTCRRWDFKGLPKKGVMMTPAVRERFNKVIDAVRQESREAAKGIESDWKLNQVDVFLTKDDIEKYIPYREIASAKEKNIRIVIDLYRDYFNGQESPYALQYSFNLCERWVRTGVPKNGMIMSKRVFERFGKITDALSKMNAAHQMSSEPVVEVEAETIQPVQTGKEVQSEIETEISSKKFVEEQLAQSAMMSIDTFAIEYRKKFPNSKLDYPSFFKLGREFDRVGYENFDSKLVFLRRVGILTPEEYLDFTDWAEMQECSAKIKEKQEPKKTVQEVQ